jgi:hypothetical protein
MVILLAAAVKASPVPSLYIRTNQLGFRPDDLKSAVILSHQDLAGGHFDIVRAGETNAVFNGGIGRTHGTYGQFEYQYRIEFSTIADPGIYMVRVLGEVSSPFTINEAVYDRVVDSLMLFFRVQRCGSAAALLHAPCHLHDITGLITGGNVQRKMIDASGGWHDAGDYVKFLNTAAYTTYTLLFAYEFDPKAFSFDHDGNGVPDVLDEAAIGLEWLLKLRLGDQTLITQVQDLRDHDQGWRLPENDELASDRPGFTGIGKNLIGILSATMALACRLRINDLSDHSFADKCLTLAENLYSIRKDVPDLDTSGSGMYRDAGFAGKMALGAVELYLATGRSSYLADAKKFATAAGSDFWWSWGDINSYAHYRLASLDTKFGSYVKKNLLSSNTLSHSHAFGEAANGTWGSCNAMLGAALQAALWKRLTGQGLFDTLAARQRDFVLGCNPWGVSFISGIGGNPAAHFHSQVAWLNGGYLPGALAAGPVTAALLGQYAIQVERPDPYQEFQTEGSVYRDDRMDYVTNEPTIAAAATAVFVMGCQSSRGRNHATN